MAITASVKDKMNSEERIKNYEQKKLNLASQLSSLKSEDHFAITLSKNTSNIFRQRKSTHAKMNLKPFNQVISINEDDLTADIEGMATYEDIVDEILKYNYLPTVVPQLKSITIGGSLAGCAIESSSFRYGLVHETMLEYEVLLGDGRIIVCDSKNEYSDLFFALPNTYGTLGYALKIKVKLIPVKKYIKLTHLHFNDGEAYFNQLNSLCMLNRANGSIAFIDGVVFNKNDMYITLGEFVDDAPFVSNYRYMKIYYQSIRHKKTDYLTTKDYIWRWDTDWFWCSKHFFMQNTILRLLLGKFMLNSTSFWKIRHFINSYQFTKFMVGAIQGKVESVIQDVEIPIQNANAYLQFFQDKIGIKPIWICPTMPYQNNVLYDFYKMDVNTLYINFGFWDVVPTTLEDGFYNRKIETKVQELHGNKSLYSSIYYTEDEFWTIYDKNRYLQLKNRYDSNNHLGDLYKKCLS